ncbi:Panacea domain-containing protein [Streptomyces sp. NPDC002755]
MTAMKLQKLVYYCQAWHLVWEGRALFPEAIRAWASGPVCPAVYELHQGPLRDRGRLLRQAAVRAQRPRNA